MNRTNRLGIAAAWALMATAGLAIGQTSGGADELAQREQIAADSSRTPGERLAAMDRALEIRRAAIQGEPGASYPADVVGYVSMLLTRLAWDAQDTTALYGVPLSAMREPAKERLRDALESCRRATDILKNRVVEAEMGRGDQSTLTADKALLQAQLPVLRARCAAVLAGLETDEALRMMLADEVIESASRLRMADPVLECRRQATVGAAQLIKGDGEAALMLFDQAAAGATSYAVRAEAEAGRALALLEAKGPDAALAAINEAAKMPPFVLAGKPEPSAQILAGDVRFRAEFARAMQVAPGPGRRAALAKAFAELQALIERTDLGMDETTRRGIALGKMATAADQAPVDTADLPAAALFARAIAMSDKRGQQGAAIELLREIVEGDPARLASLGPLAPEALWQLAALSSIDGMHADTFVRYTRAMESLRRLAKEYPDYPRATEAMEAAVMYAQRMQMMADPDPTYRDLYEKTLNDAIADFPNHRAQHLWRIEKGRLLMKLGRINEALAAYDSVPPTSNRAPDAAFLAINGLGDWMTSSDVDNQRQYAERIIERMAPSVGVIVDFIRNPPADPERIRVIQEYGALMGMTIAKAQVMTGNYAGAIASANDAIAMAQGLEEKTIIVEAPATAAKVRALVKLGRAEEAAEFADELAGDYAPVADPAITELVDGLQAEVDRSLAAGDEERAVRLSREALAPAAAAAASWAAVNKLILVDELRATEAEALARGGDGPAAAELVDDLMTRRGREMRLVLTLGEARLASDDPTGAFDLFREAAERMEHAQDHGPGYWQAWTRMLQILAAQEGGAKQEQVTREIARLRVLDPNLGGQPYKARLEALESGKP